MREALAFLVLLLLITLGWSQPFQTHYQSLFGAADSALALSPGETAAVPPGAPRPPAVMPPRVAAPATPTDRTWMFNKTTMDEPHSQSGGRHAR